MTNALDLVLERLGDYERRDGYYMALCPAHDDREPSLSIAEGDDGRVLLNCFGAERTPRSSQGLAWRCETSSSSAMDTEKVLFYPQITDATAQPCKLENYAQLKGLPVDWLKKQGFFLLFLSWPLPGT